MTTPADLPERAVPLAPLTPEARPVDAANAPLLRAADGRPQRVYHGSPAGYFARFDRAFEGANTGPASETHALGGFYFSDRPETADTYARTHDVELADVAERRFGIVPREPLPQSTIYAVYLRMARPLHVVGYPKPSDIAYAHVAGHDGIIARAGFHHEYVVFHPEQIMSIFDPEVAAAHVQQVPGFAGFAPVDTHSEAFRAWFRNSALVDEAGRPQVLFHGSQADFTAFSDSHIGTGVDAVSNLGDWGDGFYLTQDAALASRFALREGETDGTGAVVLPLYASLQNPIRAEDLYDIEGVQGMLADPYPGESLRKLLEAAGYDGILVQGGREVVVFRPNQIKSAISNRGEFSLADPDIRFARAAAQALPVNTAEAATTPAAAEVYRLFHGSRARFTTLAPSPRGFYGAGIYLTDEEATAWQYAEDAGGDGAPRVYAAEVRMQRPYVFEAPEAVDEPTSATLAKHLLAGPRLASALRMLQQRGEIGSVLQEELVRRGYDGLIVRVPDTPAEYLAFESAQVTLKPIEAEAAAGAGDSIRYRRDAGGAVRRPLPVALPRAVLDALQPISDAQALAMVAGKTGKLHGVDPAHHFDGRAAGAKRNLYGLVPPGAFVANEAGERYDGTVHLDRAYAYAAQPAGAVPPVIAAIERRSGMLHILDGGHRLSAARLRGDAQVPVIVRVPANAELVFEAERDAAPAPPLQVTLPAAPPSAGAIRAALAADDFGHHVDVYPTFTALPPYVQAKARRDSNYGVRGYWDPRRHRVGIIADSHDTIEAAVKTARHELVGHFGVERMLGEARFQEVIAMVGAAEREGNPLIVRYASKVDVEQPGLPAGRRAGEIIAHLAEDNVYDHGIMRRVWDGMRIFLRRIGFIRSDVTDARLCRLLRDSQRYVRGLRATPEPAPTPAPREAARSGATDPLSGWIPSQMFYGSIGADEADADLLRSLGVELGPYHYASGRFPARFAAEAKAALDSLTTDFDVKAIAVHRGAEVGFFSPRHRNAEWLTQRRAVLDWHLAGDRPAPQRARLQAERQAVDTALDELARPPAVGQYGPGAADFAPA